ncbi:IS30 family transposase, partial [Brachybacterium paraconglomeratum]|uniref:IS30 family transposase n=1 Tax=Brachybacterium paraconglomeratum TaxID=173362 RepID=UPI0022AFAAE0
MGLTFSDRSEISTASKAGWSVRRTARHLGRCPSVISRELHRNSTKTRGYQAVTADVRAQRRRARPQQRKVAKDPVLQARVDADLAASWTPNEIAGRLRLEAADPTVERMANSPDARGQTVSGEAIYQYIYALPKGELARRGIFLQSKRTKRRPRTTGRTRGGPIVGMVPIAERGEDAAERRVPGHWEGDLIIGKNGTSCAATLVERMSGFTGLLALPSKHAEPTADAVIEYFNALPEMMKASLAWDQGSEMAQHVKVSLATQMPVYFADPHSPWQRPSNENTNRLYREYLPKGTEIPDHQPYLTTIAEEINNRPRRRLGFLTPTESFARLLAGEPHVAS